MQEQRRKSGSWKTRSQWPWPEWSKTWLKKRWWSPHLRSCCHSQRPACRRVDPRHRRGARRCTGYKWPGRRRKERSASRGSRRGRNHRCRHSRTSGCSVQTVNLLVIQMRYRATYRVTRVEFGALLLANIRTGVALGGTVGAYFISILMFKDCQGTYCGRHCRPNRY